MIHSAVANKGSGILYNHISHDSLTYIKSFHKYKFHSDNKYKRNNHQLQKNNLKFQENNFSRKSTTSTLGHTTDTLVEDIPQRIVILVEPSPFTYVSGYKNRFCSTIKNLVDAGCEVLVITTGRGVSFPGVDVSAMQDAPTSYYGAEVVSSFSIGCPFYPQLPLTLGLSPRIYKKIKKFKPDIIHCSTPGFLVAAGWVYSKLLKLPLVLSYHTHLPKYLPKYNITFLAPLLWALMRLFHLAAHLTLTTSPMLADEFIREKVVHPDAIKVWKKGIDSDVFHPKFKSAEMRARLTGNNPQDPVIVYVGRLGAEKNLTFLKPILSKIPNLRLAFVGDGPYRESLETYFRGTKTTFLGMLHGDDLSSAYASADIFVMPSESETLGFVVMEAMASQVPVVAVKAGGIPDIIKKQGSGGFLYESGDLDAAIHFINDFIMNDEKRLNCGKLARDMVKQWDWKAATLDLLTVQYPIAIKAFKKQQLEKELNNDGLIANNSNQNPVINPA